MPQDNFLNPKKIITAGDMSADVTSDAVDVRYLDNISIQAIWENGSTPVGTLIVQGSVNYNQVGETAVWTDITLSATLSVSGNSGNALADLSAVSYPWIRIFYDRTSGSGTLTAWVSGKES